MAGYLEPHLSDFAAAGAPRLVPAVAAPLTVTQVNLQAKSLLERSLGVVTVVGEVSNYKVVAGHAYFSLKDSNSQLAAVLFRKEADALKFELKPGMSVLATGRLTIYGPYGRYQMVVDRLEPRGAGALQLAFEQLKQRLAEEGLFAAARKRPIPRLPRRVAVVTSPTGAVIRDIVHVATRRFPNADILVVPTKVQGGEAAPFIARAIARISMQALMLGVDVIIVARGGGSLEDLWGFNDERVARAISASSVPVVSAVGHETDFTIADFVADCRAPTPSAAAELVFPNVVELVRVVQGLRDRCHQAVKRDLARARYRVVAVRRLLGDGATLVRERTQRLLFAQSAVTTMMKRRVLQRRLRLQQTIARVQASHPKMRLRHLHHAVHRESQRLVFLLRKLLQSSRHRLASSGHKLHALSPLAVLDRGYSIVLRSDGSAVRDEQSVKANELLDIRLAKGSIQARVESSRTKETP